MAYWVHGHDARTGKPDSMLSTANTPDEAREQAAKQGLIAQTIQLEANPNIESIPLPLINPPRIFRLRYKWIGMLLFASGILIASIMYINGWRAYGLIFFEQFSCVIFAFSFVAWGIGCVFQSRTWKSFKLGCLIGIVMFIGVIFSLLLSRILAAH